MKKQEGDSGVNPPPSAGDLDNGSGSGGGATPPTPHTGPRFWIPEHVLQRVFAAHGFVERYDEGNHSVLKEAIWQFAAPVRVQGCHVIVTYNAAWRITKWRLSDNTRTSQETVFIEPRIATTRTFVISGCDPSKPISNERQERQLEEEI